MRRVLVIALMVLAAGAGGAQAQTPQALTVIDQAGVPAPELQRVEHAIVDEVAQARKFWPNLPPVVFADGGWDIALYTPAQFSIYFPTTTGSGFHYVRMGQPAANVAAGAGWSVYLSHEVLEMLADPNTGGDEIADPVEACHTELDGVAVSDFVTPKWFADRHGRGLDWRNALAPNGWLDATTLGGRCVPIPVFDRHPGRYVTVKQTTK